MNINKPDWSTAPEWANYLAMDAQGQWYWFEKEPEPNVYELYWSNTPFSNGKTLLASESELTWETSLEKRPK